MSGRRLAVILLATFVVALDAAGAERTATSEAAPTFNKDIAPILFANCVSCHRPGEVAPMSLMTYDDVRPYARSIKTKVAARAMPPWHADPRFGDFVGRRALGDADIETLVQWVDAGAPRGEGEPPAAPAFPDGWNGFMNRPPDMVIEAPMAFEIPAAGELPTFLVWTKLPFADDRWIEAVELRPTNRRVMHHGSANVGPLPAGAAIGRGPAWPGGPVLDAELVRSDGRPFVVTSVDEFGKPLVFYVPGGGFLKFPPGVAKHIGAGDVLSFGVHYTATGQVERDRPRLGLWFAKSPARRQALTITISDRKFVDGKELPRDKRGQTIYPKIPAFARDWSIQAETTLDREITIHAVWPHMHLRGKDMTILLRYPSGKEVTLVSVPEYDPNWQVTYELARPLSVPAGSTLRAVAHYDNSAGNRRNPAPDQDVAWGWQTWEEMFHPYVEVSLPRGQETVR